MKIKEVLWDKILVEMLPKQELKSTSGILLESDQNVNEYHTSRAIVVRLGPTAFKEYKEAGLTHPSEGTKVVMAKYAGDNYESFGEDKTKVFRIVRDTDILGVLDE